MVMHSAEKCWGFENLNSPSSVEESPMVMHSAEKCWGFENKLTIYANLVLL
jgi:hypothetical protein